MMAEGKILLMMLSFIIPPLWIFAFIENFDNIKSTVLFIVAIIMGIIRFYFTIINAIQNQKLKDLDIRKKEKELEEPK